MSKRVVIIASGETERRALPHFVGHLLAEGISVVEVRCPNRNKALTVEMAERLIKAVWFAPPENTPPDKFVVLVDVDGKDPDHVLQPFRKGLRKRLGPGITASIQFAYAQWHLESWYFADSDGLRTYLERDLGHIDASQPDRIENPKQHLKNLLANRVYTAIVAEEIAGTLNVQAIRRSDSFRGFLAAVRNGDEASVTVELA